MHLSSTQIPNGDRKTFLYKLCIKNSTLNPYTAVGNRSALSILLFDERIQTCFQGNQSLPP